MIARMSLLQSLVYGVVQGLTEFLPVSSSAHLILVPVFTGWDDPGLAFNVALHWGTLIAVVGYFRKDVAVLIRGWVGSFRGERNPENVLPWQIALATVPGAVFGFILEEQAETVFRSPWVIVVTLSALAVLLYIAERVAPHRIPVERVGWVRAFLIGVLQGIAIVPGVSRSGVTITAALFLGLERTAAVRFSFYLSMPIILGAGLLESGYLLGNLRSFSMWVAMAAAAVSGAAAIHLLLTYVRTRTFTPFVIYRLALALVIAGWMIF